MYTLKGFVLMQPLANNDPSQVSLLGELSNYSKTFSKDITHYSDSTYPSIDLMVYLSRSVVDDVGTSIVVPNDHKNKVLEITNWMYSQALSSTFTSDSSTFTSAFLTQFSADVDDFESGEMVTSGSNIYLPEWIGFSIRGLADNKIKLWFSDAAFQQQYDEYEIVVVPPISDIDQLFQTPTAVKALLDQVTYTERQERITAAKNKYPDTKTRVETYPWTNPQNLDITLNLPWSVIIYGPAGDNADAIKNAIGQFIRDTSSTPVETWTDFIPDLFKSTEYLIYPAWEEFSIPNQRLVTGLNTPTMSIVDINKHMTYINSLENYPEAHINENTEYSVANYKSLGFFIVGSPENRDGVFKFKARWSDYFVTPTNGPDFGRMGPATQDFVIVLGRLLATADIATEFSDIPLDMSKIKRGDKLYITKTYNDVLYAVMTRSSYERPA